MPTLQSPETGAVLKVEKRQGTAQKRNPWIVVTVISVITVALLWATAAYFVMSSGPIVE